MLLWLATEESKMKVIISNEHRRFFQKHHAIEFEDYLTQEQLDQLNILLDEALCERLHVPKDQLAQIHFEKTYTAGRDLWRQNAELQKKIAFWGWAQVASHLLEKTPLRLAYDQLFVSSKQIMPPTEPQDALRHLIWHPTSLEEMSSLKGILCGLMIALQGELEEEKEGISIFPKKAGNAVYFSPTIPIDFSPLISQHRRRYLLIVYTQQSTTYILQPKDPHMHTLKKLGYGIGDTLKEKLHPIVYR